MARRSRPSFDAPRAAAKDAARALDWRRAGHRGGTAVGVARARDLAHGRPLSQRTVDRMRSYFARHEVDARAEGFRPGERGYPSPGRVAWGLWGGNAGAKFAREHATKNPRILASNPNDDLAQEDAPAYFVDDGDGQLYPQHDWFDLALSDALTRVIRDGKPSVQIVHGNEARGFAPVADVVLYEEYPGRRALWDADHPPEAVLVIRDASMAEQEGKKVPRVVAMNYGTKRSGKRDRSWVAVVSHDEEIKANFARTGAIVANPPWTTRLIAKHLEEMESNVPPAWMPKLTRADVRGNKLRASVREYGCGAYGCVFPTLDDTIVLKVTTDDSEAQFAREIAETLPYQITVNYPLILDVPEKKKGYPVSFLWRDSAQYAGKLDVYIDKQGGNGAAAERAIEKQHKTAKKAFKLLVKGKDATEALDAWVEECKRMGDAVPLLAELAEGLAGNLREAGVFISDVHGGNIGLVRGKWLVIDPGNVVVLTDEVPKP